MSKSLDLASHIKIYFAEANIPFGNVTAIEGQMDGGLEVIDDNANGRYIGSEDAACLIEAATAEYDMRHSVAPA